MASIRSLLWLNRQSLSYDRSFCNRLKLQQCTGGTEAWSLKVGDQNSGSWKTAHTWDYGVLQFPLRPTFPLFYPFGHFAKGPPGWRSGAGSELEVWGLQQAQPVPHPWGSTSTHAVARPPQEVPPQVPCHGRPAQCHITNPSLPAGPS